MTAHGLPYNPSDARLKWVRLARTARVPERETVPESEFDKLPYRNRQAILLYKDTEEARMRVIQQRIRDRFKMKRVFQTPPGVNPTELVLRYLDSRPVNEDREAAGAQDHDSHDREFKETSISKPEDHNP